MSVRLPANPGGLQCCCGSAWQSPYTLYRIFWFTFCLLMVYKCTLDINCTSCFNQFILDLKACKVRHTFSIICLTIVARIKLLSNTRGFQYYQYFLQWIQNPNIYEGLQYWNPYCWATIDGSKWFWLAIFQPPDAAPIWCEHCDRWTYLNDSLSLL